MTKRQAQSKESQSSQTLSRRNYIKGLSITGLLGISGIELASARSSLGYDSTARFESQAKELVTVSRNDSIVVNEETVPVSSDVELTSFTHLFADGWVRGYRLTAALDQETSAGLVSPGLTAAAPVSEMTNSAGAVAGVNGDFFDINGTNAPIGAEIGARELHKGPAPGRTGTVGVDEDGLGRIANVTLSGSVTFHDGEQSLTALNESTLARNGVGLFTPLWGSTSRTNVVQDATRVREVIVQEGTVAAASSTITDTPIPENGYVLIGRETGAKTLNGLSTGDSIDIAYSAETDSPSPLSFAVGGNPQLLYDGQLPETLDDERAEPRTAAGVSDDGSTLYLVAIDGRQRFSRGVTLFELGTLMRHFGATDAINLDGGGSTTLVARDAGTEHLSVANSPSDGSERAVPNGVGLFTPTGTTLDGFRIEPYYDETGGDRVFPGLTRTFVAYGHDDTYAPVDASRIRWRTRPRSRGRVTETEEKDDLDADSVCVFTARRPGQGRLTARQRRERGSTELTILGALDRIEASVDSVGLAGVDDSETFSVVGYDEEGYRAPIEPRDITVSVDGSDVELTSSDQGAFTVTATTDSGSALIEIEVQGETAFLPVTIGLATKSASEFEDPSAWSFSKYPSAVEGAMQFVSGRTGQGLKLSYDFATTTATRAAYARADPLLELPGEPRRLGLWVDGDGNGAWLRATVRDATDVDYNLNLARHIDWTGWRYVEATVPNGVHYPLKLRHIYPVEIDSSTQYTGSLVYDDLQVKVSPAVETPEQTPVRDPTIVTNGKTEDGWRFAMMADSQFTADNPTSEIVKRTRRTLREIVAADPEFLLIGGDFVDRGYEEDFQLARRILDEEVGEQLPVYYVPGNHERTGTDSLENFRSTFGETHQTFDHNGTRFILLNSSTGSFRTAEFDQLFDLQDELETVRTDSDIDGCVVVAHHPPHDPLPANNSQLGDRQEAELIEEWLAEFEIESDGKSAAYIAGHAGTAHARHVDGVPYVIVPPSGKDPYGPADNGGFIGWTMVSVDSHPASKAHRHTNRRDQWIQTAMHPLFDSVALTAPDTLAVGDEANIKAIGTQPGGRTIPLAYPATVRWSGSENVYVLTENRKQSNSRKHDSDRYDAVFDPALRTLRAVRPGTVTLRVTANGETASTTLSLRQPSDK
ncbi:phosphodiester glycosidase family protein [Halocatena marina]|uniref:phosphodiester glycosidase family protein n=1 Tax=Halocatena marina TaxID=2934937 RepID=UPI002223F1FB|nr:phosphodiester glycosidase family protein [Halocatena marina]